VEWVAWALLFLLDLTPQSAKFLFVPADLGGNGFESLAEEVEFDHDAAEGMSLSITAPMFFDDGAQFGSPIQGGFGNCSVRGDGSKGDSLAFFD